MFEAPLKHGCPIYLQCSCVVCGAISHCHDWNDQTRLVIASPVVGQSKIFTCIGYLLKCFKDKMSIHSYRYISHHALIVLSLFGFGNDTFVCDLGIDDMIVT